MSLSKLGETVKDREAWCAADHRAAMSWTQLSDRRATTCTLLLKGRNIWVWMLTGSIWSMFLGLLICKYIAKCRVNVSIELNIALNGNIELTVSSLPYFIAMSQLNYLCHTLNTLSDTGYLLPENQLLWVLHHKHIHSIRLMRLLKAIMYIKDKCDVWILTNISSLFFQLG